jgi:RNA polymerase sigma-70 factor (ECF subfamily)
MDERTEDSVNPPARAAVDLPDAGSELANEPFDAERAEDHALIRRAQSGEEPAFERLVQRHQQRAWRVARNLVASDEDAQDLAQEAFLRVFRSLASFDFQHGFTTWLYRIVTNLAIDHLRKRRTAVSTTRADDEEGDFDLPDTRVGRPSQAIERTELAREVRDCLAALAPHFQSVLVLREMEGLPCNEIAHIVGATHVTVRWRLHRGRKLFQEEWERRQRLTHAAPPGTCDTNTDRGPSVVSDAGDGEGSGG